MIERPREVVVNGYGEGQQKRKFENERGHLSEESEKREMQDLILF